MSVFLGSLVSLVSLVCEDLRMSPEPATYAWSEAGGWPLLPKPVGWTLIRTLTSFLIMVHVP
ncbi:MAG: hypothetical protein QG622_2240 [Actinomycetota bacterium]|nr:hypothetical protein [Actinomycetota bacterium]